MIDIYDIECFPNFFSYTSLERDTGKISSFVIHKSRNDFKSLILHLNDLKGQIGFNNINYDYPILHYILKNKDELLIWYDNDPELITDILYKKSQSVIKEEYSAISENEVIIPQLDLFRIHHFDNKAKNTSLKDIEFAINFPNLQSLPYSFDHIVKDEEVDGIVLYNLNDVKATENLYKITIGDTGHPVYNGKNKIMMRKDFSKLYGINLMNANDAKIGSEIVLDLYCKKTGLNKSHVKKLRTSRNYIYLNQCIFPHISFTSTQFSDLLKHLKSKVISGTDEVKHSVVYKGFKYDYGSGGIHGSVKPGIYKSDEEWIIMDCDVSSLYPMIAVVNRMYPAHLGEVFCDIYKTEIVEKRLKAKAEGNSVISEGLKLAANSVFGKSNDQYSFLYDPAYTVTTTINGQLLLTMLAETLSEISDLKMLQINTDGLTIRIKRKYLSLYYEICKRWEELTKLSLEYVPYNQMIIRDCNNYIAQKEDGRVKYKGTFEIDKELHKNSSGRIIRIALSDYFIQGIPVEDTIRLHDDINDYFYRFKLFKGWKGVISTKDGEENLPKTNRFFISRSGGYLIKKANDGRKIRVIEGFTSKVVNKIETTKASDYDINHNFYIRECYKIINVVKPLQLSLFNE